MAIQMRRGLRKDFDPYKMLPGEWAVSIDASTSNQIVWMCFEPGVCKRMGTYEDFVAQIKEATADIKTEYVEEFDKILDEIKALSSQVSVDKDAVVLVKTTIEDEYLPKIQESLSEIQEKANEAKNSADAAAVSAENAKKSEVNAKNSETEAKTSETNAATSESNAKNSASSASTSASTATKKATEASTYANNAKNSENTANTHATTASNKASEASTSANTASVKANDASDSALLAESYTHGGTGVRDNEDVDNAQYYKNQAERISQGLSGALLPMGTITFSQLANQTKQAGYMYNISNSFTTNNTFKEGAGYSYPEGTNVYYTADGYWDCLAGTSVVGVKGSAESSYRKGNVNITAENVGAIPTTGNNYGNTVFGSSNTTEWGECATSTLGGTENTVDDGWGTLLKVGAMRPLYLFYAWNTGKVYIKRDDGDYGYSRIALAEDVLNSLEEIEANTSEENIAGALAIKSLNSKVSDLTNNSGYYLGTTGSLTIGADETITIPDLTDYKFLLFVFNGTYVAEFVSLLELHFALTDKFSRKTVTDGYYFKLKVILVEGGINIKIEEIAGYSYGAIAIYGLK